MSWMIGVFLKIMGIGSRAINGETLAEPYLSSHPDIHVCHISLSLKGLMASIRWLGHPVYNAELPWRYIL